LHRGLHRNIITGSKLYASRGITLSVIRSLTPSFVDRLVAST